MRVLLVCPFGVGSRSGNRRTAVRWAKLLRSLGHRARVVTELPPRARADVLVALHARRSADAVREWRARHPEGPIVVALTGTDLYQDLAVDASARRSLAIADRLVVLHPLAPGAVPARFRDKVHVIVQSAVAPRKRPPRASRSFDVVVVGHLRAVKDPMRTALAARRLPPASRVRVLHAGGALDAASRREALAEERRNPRYLWLGEVTPSAALRLIARAQLLSLTSRLEGGANVLGEAIVCGTPVVASRIAAAKALLGADYPALFSVGDTRALARLLDRAERDARFRADLARRVRGRRRLFDERREASAWRELLGGVRGTTPSRR